MYDPAAGRDGVPPGRAPLRPRRRTRELAEGALAGLEGIGVIDTNRQVVHNAVMTRPFPYPQTTSPPTSGYTAPDTPVTSSLADPQADSSAASAWSGIRIVAFVLTLLALGVQTTWTLNDFTMHPSFHAGQGLMSQPFSSFQFYTQYTLGAWWLVLLLAPVIAVLRNRPSIVAPAAALQLLLIDVLLFKDSIVDNPLPVLGLLATGSAAIATIYASRHAPLPPLRRSWPVNLGMAVNLFILVSMLHRLMMVARDAAFGLDLSVYKVNIWMTFFPSLSPESPGAPVTLGLVLTIIAAVVSCVSIYLGLWFPHSIVFARLVGIAPMIVALMNMYILSVSGVSGAAMASALGLTSIDEGAFPHIALRAWEASILLGVIAMGATALIHRQASAGRHNQVTPGAPSNGIQPPSQHQTYHSYTSYTQ